MPERWKSRLRTAVAMLLLCWGRLVVAALPFHRWRGTLGQISIGDSRDSLAEARRAAAHVNHAARLLPFHTKCLPRAMALSWLLRWREIGHGVVFAVRPADQRGSDDQLHAWVEVGDEIVIGELNGPWAETLRLGDGGRYRQANMS